MTPPPPVRSTSGPARALWLWLPVAAWSALLFALSSSSSLPAPPPHVTDKMLHTGAFAVLGATLVRAFSGARWSGVTWRVALLAVALTTVYGVSDEFHQSFVPKRSVETLDVAADFTGAVIAASLALVLRVGLGRRRPIGTADGPAGRI